MSLSASGPIESSAFDIELESFWAGHVRLVLQACHMASPNNDGVADIIPLHCDWGKLRNQIASYMMYTSYNHHSKWHQMAVKRRLADDKAKETWEVSNRDVAKDEVNLRRSKRLARAAGKKQKRR